MPTKNPEKLRAKHQRARSRALGLLPPYLAPVADLEERRRKERAKQRRKRANRLARDPAYALATTERLRKLKTLYPANPERTRTWQQNYLLARRGSAQDWQVAAAGRKRPETCEVCGATGRRIVFDHCHATDKFRGWICSSCNTALGHAHDSADTLRKLAVYLEAFPARSAELPTIASQRLPRPRKPPHKRAAPVRDWLLVGTSL